MISSKKKKLLQSFLSHDYFWGTSLAANRQKQSICKAKILFLLRVLYLFRLFQKKVLQNFQSSFLLQTVQSIRH